MDKISRKGAIIDLLALPLAATAVGSMATAALAADDSGGTKKQYKYVDKSKVAGKKCSGCALFKAPNGCQIVKGKISPNGYCIAWSKKG